ncbi:MAG: hypothetical protein WAT66_00315 [Actinomycetota bacterium]
MNERSVLTRAPRDLEVEVADRPTRSPRTTMRLGAGLVVLLALVLTVSGVRTGLTVMDEDEAVYVHTLRSMRSGEGYYPAIRDALVEKEGVPPSNVRAIRPPTMFLFVRWIPEHGWRWAAGGVFLASLLLVWELARREGHWAGIVAAVVAFLWLAPASPYLFLHAELWGLPFFLAGLLNLRRGRDGWAAFFLTIATLTRELFGFSILLALIVRRRREWWYALAASLAGGFVHALLAGQILSPSGRDAQLHNVGIDASLIFKVLGPGTTAFSVVVGLGVLALALPGLLRRMRESDPAAAVLLPFTFVLAAAGIVATRLYWSLTWGPAIAAFVPAGVSVLLARPLAKAQR